MTVSVRIYCQRLEISKIWDNDLGWLDSFGPSEEGFIFGSDQVQDNLAQDFLDLCQEVDIANDYISGEVWKTGFRFTIHVWLNNPKLEPYPMMNRWDEAMAILSNGEFV